MPAPAPSCGEFLERLYGLLEYFYVRRQEPFLRTKDETEGFFVSSIELIAPAGDLQEHILLTLEVEDTECAYRITAQYCPPQEMQEISPPPGPHTLPPLGLRFAVYSPPAASEILEKLFRLIVFFHVDPGRQPFIPSRGRAPGYFVTLVNVEEQPAVSGEDEDFGSRVTSVFVTLDAGDMPCTYTLKVEQLALQDTD